MVYTSSGQPLYIPPYARKQQTRPQEQSETDMQDNGMQSLLSAIELDMSNRSLTPHVSDHSFVDSPDHQELMADLLRTNFTSDEAMGHTDEHLGQDIAADSPYGSNLSTMEPIHPESQLVHTPLELRNDPHPFGNQLSESARRVWLGLHDEWVDKQKRHAQIRRVIRAEIEHLREADNTKTIPKSSRVTKISFAWPAVAQKSYGTEKRLLTPGPICRLSGFHEIHCGNDPKAHLSLLPSAFGHCILPPQTLDFDRTQKVSFKNLHINNDNIGKSKSVRLKLNLSQRGFPDPAAIPLVEFSSSDVLLLSKPSKRAGRLKLQNSFIYAGDSISLYNRINSQTVRTKYLAVEHGEMCAQADLWTPFRIHPYLTDSNQLDMTDKPLQYDMTIVLSNPSDSYMSCPMIIRRLEGKSIAHGSTANISQMQKVAFERLPIEGLLPADPERRFLSARRAQATKEQGLSISPFTEFESYQVPGSDVISIDDSGQWTIVGVGSTEMIFLDTLSGLVEGTEPSQLGDLQTNNLTSSTQMVDAETRKRKFDDPAGPGLRDLDIAGAPSTTESVSTPTLDPAAAAADAADTSSGVTQNDSASQPPPPPLPTIAAPEVLTHLRIQVPLTPFPTLLAEPVILLDSNRLHLQVRDFWQPNSAFSSVPDVWLGEEGPLKLMALQQSLVFPTDAAIEVELPEDFARSSASAGKTPVLFVREDGIVILAGTIDRSRP